MIQWLGLLIWVLGFLIEVVSDTQKSKFNKKNKGAFIDVGLWKYIRHPNYLGEILFWFGLFGFSLSQSLDNFWLIICPLSMFAMFIFASIPMMDNRSLERRQDYEEYMK